MSFSCTLMTMALAREQTHALAFETIVFSFDGCKPHSVSLGSAGTIVIKQQTSALL
jgi:hypothetical protein